MALEKEKKLIIDDIQKLDIKDIGNRENADYKELDDKRKAVVVRLNSLESEYWAKNKSE